MSQIHVVILAAGKGTRMRSRLPKVLHRVAGAPMLDYVIRTALELEPASITVVLGHKPQIVREALAAYGSRVATVEQAPQLGTAHAVLQTEALLGQEQGSMLVLSGDVPLLRSNTLNTLLAAHRESTADATVLTATVGRPYGYGRIVRKEGALHRIVEERDASPQVRRIKEINAGVYVLALGGLFARLREIAAENAQGEFYLPEVVAIVRRQGGLAATATAEDPREIRGINSQTELAEVSAIVRQSRNEELMAAGVTIEDPATTYVGPDVEVGPDTVIHPNVYLEGSTRVGEACVIHAGARIVDSTIESGAVVQNYCVITSSRVATGTSIGPFAHLRPGSDVQEGARIGNFVEIKKSTVGPGSKAGHLTYLGDATLGRNVNVGAGTITCNYDGRQKHPTIIEDEVFVGSDSQLVAPVRVGAGAYIAAGSTITADVPGGALAIARARQTVKEDWTRARASAQAGDASGAKG